MRKIYTKTFVYFAEIQYIYNVFRSVEQPKITRNIQA